MKHGLANLLVLLALCAAAVSCGPELPDDEPEPQPTKKEYHFKYNIGTLDNLPDGLNSYKDCCNYVSKLDGFMYEPKLYYGHSTLLSALTDYNIPIADSASVDSRAEIFIHAKNLMDTIITLDTHCDFPEQRYYNKSKNYSLSESQSRCQVSIERMKQGHQCAQYLATWMSVSGSQTSKSALASAPATLWEFVKEIDDHLSDNSSLCGLARNKEEILELKKQGKIAFLYGLENGFWTGTDLGNLEKLAKKGFTYVTLSHNGDNQICHSALSSNDSSLGLTDFGREYVAKMNELGLVIDLSHTSKATWREVLELSKAPVAFSHSGAAALYKHGRNVDDETLRILAKKGGVIQIYIVQGWMSNGNSSEEGLNDLVNHIDHCVKVAGIDHVGVGIDLDGGGGGERYNASNDAINLTVALIEKGYSDSDIAKVWGENYLRVLSEAQALATAK